MRIYRFKLKYEKRVERRNRMMLWLKVGGAVVLAAAAVIAYLLLRRPPEELIGPDPDMLRPAPSAVTGPDIARPTQPSASASTAPPEPAPRPDGPKPGQK